MVVGGDVAVGAAVVGAGERAGRRRLRSVNTRATMWSCCNHVQEAWEKWSDIDLSIDLGANNDDNGTVVESVTGVITTFSTHLFQLSSAALATASSPAASGWIRS